MGFSYNIQETTKPVVVTAGVYLVCALIALASGLETQLDDHFLLNYEVTDNNTKINLNITAINVTGWVAIGINDMSPKMAGSDWFVGGVFDNGKEYGNDYHGPNIGYNSKLTVDLHNDWDIIHATENSANTTLNITRLLDTGDTQDLPIQNKTLYLVWQYDNKTDFTDDPEENIKLFHSNLTSGRGIRAINLVSIQDSATDINFGIGTLLVCLSIALFQNVNRLSI